MRSQSHRSVTNQSFDSLNWNHKGRTKQHDENEETKHFILVHHPQKYRKELEESKGVNELVSKNTTKFPNGYLQNIMLVKLLFFWFSKCSMNDSP